MTHYIDTDPHNDGRPSLWISDPMPGGWICAEPDGRCADGICGDPIESEPCQRHGPPRVCNHSAPYTVDTDAEGWPILTHPCGHVEGYSHWWGTGEVMEVAYSLA